MAIKEITDQKTWDDLVTSFPDYTFLQGWNWGEFQKAMGERVWRFETQDKRHKIQGVCQAITVTASRGKFLFVPHGPLVKVQDPRLKTQEIYKELTSHLANLAKREGCSFLRISPWVKATGENKEIFRELGFRPAPMLMHTEETWLVDIAKPEEQLLSQMRKTTRNLIRRAQRDGVVIDQIQDTGTTTQEAVKKLHELQRETVKRHHFVPFSQKYLETEFKIFSRDNQALLFLGKYAGRVYAAAVIIFYGQFAFYFHSASKETNIPVNYLLQWEVIREAKSRGCQVYNLWGVAPENKPNHPWAGLTVFKSGFGGFRKDYMHAQDLPLSPKYWLTYTLEKIPRTWRQALNTG